MVVYDTIEQDGRRFNRARSDAGRLIADAQGRRYADAVWPLGEDREFAETRIPIDAEDGAERACSWTPLSIKRACGERWPEVRAALEASDIYEDFVMAQELREDDEAFKTGYAWAVARYGKATVDAVLAAAESAIGISRS